MGLLEAKSREVISPTTTGGLSMYRNRELYASGNYELFFDECEIVPTATATGMFIVVSSEPNKYTHYAVKSDLTLDSVEIVRAVSDKIKEAFPHECCLYTPDTAYELVVHKDKYKDSMVSTDVYSARHGYAISDGDFGSAFERALVKELIPSDAKMEDYFLLSKDGKVTYFKDHAPGDRKVYTEGYRPFVRTFNGRLFIGDRGSVVSKTKPDSRYQIYQELGENKIAYVCGIETDARGRRSIEAAKAGDDYVCESVAEYLLTVFKNKY